MDRERKAWSRVELAQGLDAVVAELAMPRTVKEVAQATGLHRRTVYRILKVLPKSGVTLDVTETARVRGAGKPERRYQVTTTVTSKPPPPLAVAAVRRATVMLQEAMGDARSAASLADDLKQTVSVRTVRSLQEQLASTIARVLDALVRADSALARADVEGRQVTVPVVAPATPASTTPAPSSSLPTSRSRERAVAPHDARLKRDREAYFALGQHLREAHGVLHHGDREALEAAHEEFKCAWVNPVDGTAPR